MMHTVWHTQETPHAVLPEARSFPAMAWQSHIRMIRPDAFRVEDAINPHMQNASGELNTPNLDLAHYQWHKLREAYETIAVNAPQPLTLSVLPCTPHLPDMVFAANQALPALLPCGEKVAVLSHMANPVRHLEVDAVSRGLEAIGYRTLQIPPAYAQEHFEGMGDALWVPGRRLLLGGYGFRTSQRIYEWLSQVLHTDIVTFALLKPRFYHLDTCLSLLNETTVLACLEAFTTEGIDALYQLFPHVLEVPLSEADSPGFACNAHCPDGQHVILQEGNTITETMLKQRGFIPVPVNTSEYVLSGGSVFCMKVALF
ncbi:MAG: dimethylarginine dimethylaminohydrolase family protein [Vampirovibrionales bacterium]